MLLQINNYLPLTDLIIGNAFLSTALEPKIVHLAALCMLGDAACHALAPHLEGRGQGMGSHEIYELAFCKTKLQMNGIKGGAVFPGHLYDAICLFWIKRSFHFFAFYILHCSITLDPNPVPIFFST